MGVGGERGEKGGEKVPGMGLAQGEGWKRGGLRVNWKHRVRWVDEGARGFWG